MEPVLTIAVPTYNMAWCLEKNLNTYCSSGLRGKLEVIVLNNHSSDRSGEIACGFCQREPEIFRLFDRDSRGYGSSVNEALRAARGKYFRIVDADDWVDTGELEKLVERLEGCEIDIIQTDYVIEDMMTQERTVVTAGEKGCRYDLICKDFITAVRSLPTLYSTTYRTGLLRAAGFYMQDKTFFVDEEYIVLPFFRAKSMIYFPFAVYHYQVANPEQSTSPKNRGKYAEHRERVLKRLIGEYRQAALWPEGMAPHTLDYCLERIRRGVADHFTTLYIYVEDRRAGRAAAKSWERYISSLDMKLRCRSKQRILSICNLMKMSPQKYNRIKNLYVSQIFRSLKK